ncbi:MAG TPA: hypothetical protein DER07_02140 [Armatimonadetes bacterium]|nr:hypothetical protein [Armatimonadota bacterium]
MLALIAALTIATYSPPAAEGWTYRVRLTFDGDLPLLGGQRGKAEVLLGLRAESTPASEVLAARIEPQAFEIRFNGEPLPLTLDDARPYLPPTTLRYSPSGKVLSNDAPEPNIPVRIPGLHPKRLPETVLLPIELPEGAIDRGTRWKYAKPLGDATATFEARVQSSKGDRLTINLRVEQDSTALENEALQIVATEAEAATKASTRLTGSGQATFDRSLGAVTSFFLKGSAVTAVQPLDGRAGTSRKLRFEYDVRLESKAKAR